ncbi:Uncharacterised protein [Mycobacterium tuberculosis]|nr:Uncharacterised protein [Mycobacterium tuberculosis]
MTVTLGCKFDCHFITIYIEVQIINGVTSYFKIIDAYCRSFQCLGELNGKACYLTISIQVNNYIFTIKSIVPSINDCRCYAILNISSCNVFCICLEFITIQSFRLHHNISSRDCRCVTCCKFVIFSNLQSNYVSVK